MTTTLALLHDFGPLAFLTAGLALLLIVPALYRPGR